MKYKPSSINEILSFIKKERPELFLSCLAAIKEEHNRILRGEWTERESFLTETSLNLGLSCKKTMENEALRIFQQGGVL